MTNEEAIGRIQDHIQHHGIGQYPHLKLGEALDMAISALRSADHFRDLTKMIPLTLEQLREMDGYPVWAKVLDARFNEENQWAICNAEYQMVTLKDGFKLFFCGYKSNWLAYAYPPAHIDREAWEKPCSMCGGKTTLYQHTNTTKLLMNTFGKAATLVTECMACPPYADCCMKGISANSAFKINFCPECGRPLTGEAWAKLEKRIGVRE